jgi:hypothetical protein
VIEILFRDGCPQFFLSADLSKQIKTVPISEISSLFGLILDPVIRKSLFARITAPVGRCCLAFALPGDRSRLVNEFVKAAGRKLGGIDQRNQKSLPLTT